MAGLTLQFSIKKRKSMSTHAKCNQEIANSTFTGFVIELSAWQCFYCFVQEKTLFTKLVFNVEQASMMIHAHTLLHFRTWGLTIFNSVFHLSQISKSITRKQLFRLFKNLLHWVMVCLSQWIHRYQNHKIYKTINYVLFSLHSSFSFPRKVKVCWLKKIILPSWIEQIFSILLYLGNCHFFFFL